MDYLALIHRDISLRFFLFRDLMIVQSSKL